MCKVRYDLLPVRQAKLVAQITNPVPRGLLTPLLSSKLLNDLRVIGHTRYGDQSKTTQYTDHLRWQQPGSECQFEQTKTFQLS